MTDAKPIDLAAENVRLTKELDEMRAERDRYMGWYYASVAENARLKEALVKANDAYEDGRWTDIHETANTMHAILDAALASLDAQVKK